MQKKDAQFADKSLDMFVEKLFEEKCYENLSSETAEVMKEDLRERVEDHINAVIIANLPTEKLEYFEQLLDRATEEEVQDFCRRNIPGLEQLVAQRLMEFRQTYLG